MAVEPKLTTADELLRLPRARDGTRHELVRALVDARIEVDRITPRRGLEEAFLALVGES